MASQPPECGALLRQKTHASRLTSRIVATFFRQATARSPCARRHFDSTVTGLESGFRGIKAARIAARSVTWRRDCNRADGFQNLILKR